MFLKISGLSKERVAQKEEGWRKETGSREDLGDEEDENAKGCTGANTHQHDLLPNPPRPAVIPGWKLFFQDF